MNYSTSHASDPRVLAWRVTVAFALYTALVTALIVQAADPDPLQDFCVADFSPNAPRVNGYPCKARANVTSKDFLFTGFRKAGDVNVSGTNSFQINVGSGPAVTFNSLNSQFPGFLITANQLLETQIPAAVLEASLGINATNLQLLQAAAPPFWSLPAP
jgi:hypothetical protein